MLLAIIGYGVSSLLQTYVRTGLAMFLVGAAFLIFQWRNALSRRSVWPATLLLGGAVLMVWVVSTDETLVARLFDQRGDRDYVTFEQLGSGRGGLLLASLRIFNEMTVYESLFGVGPMEARLRMEVFIGAKINAHNGFLNLLLQVGIVGLILFFAFLVNLYRSIEKKSGDAALGISMISAFFTLVVLQTYDMLYPFVLTMAAVFSTKQLEREAP